MPIDMDKLKKLIIEKGMSYTELSLKSGLSKVHISRMVNGKVSTIHPKTAKALTDALNASIEEIF